MIKNRSAQRTKAILPICQRANRIVLLSGASCVLLISRLIGKQACLGLVLFR